MAERKVNIFISHISEEQVEAAHAKEYLELVFRDMVEIFSASSWTSIAPGEDWFSRIQVAIEKADVMLVLCSGDSVGRAWIQFETGAGWFAKHTKVIPVCHKGMTPAALPEPIRRLQAVDINAPSEAEQLNKLAAAIRQVTDLPLSAPINAEELPLASAEAPSFKGWMIRPGSHVGEELEGIFRVGQVGISDGWRVDAAEMDRGDALHVRLYFEPPNGVYVNAMAGGRVATLFEKEDAPGSVVKARIKLRAAYQGSYSPEKVVPIITVEHAERRQE